MKTEHTPGPWKLIPADGITFKWPAIQRGEEGGFVVKGRSDLQAKADAHLIAAAPDMLECLKLIMGNSTNFRLKAPDYMIDKIDAAIAKAEGRAS